MRTRVVTSAQLGGRVTGELRRMLSAAFDGDFGEHDWQHSLGGHHVLAESDEGEVLAHASVVPRTLWVDGRPYRTGYLEAVACAPAHRGVGLGSQVVAVADDLVRAHFELGALSTGRWSFYEHLGWERWQGPTFVRTGAAATRTPEEDDGVMVLRTASSQGIDLAGGICCEAREGDDW